MESFEEKMRRGGGAAVQEMCRFFMRDDPVHTSLRRIAERLDKLGIAYAVAGGMSLGVHGYDRATVDVDILVTPEGLRALHEKLTGAGYLPPFSGSRNLRDTETGVSIEFIVSGAFPGDGKPKPVAFPDPATCAIRVDGIAYLSLGVLMELKLSSGMTHPGRLRDLADAQELIRVAGLPREFAETLHPFVRAKYQELWDGAQMNPTAQ